MLHAELLQFRLNSSKRVMIAMPHTDVTATSGHWQNTAATPAWGLTVVDPAAMYCVGLASYSMALRK